MSQLTVPGLPFPLTPRGEPASPAEPVDGGIRLTAAPGTDLFRDPAGSDSPPDAGRWLGVPPDGDFSLSARVAVEFAGTFDAGVLLLHTAEDRWAKLCFEYSPARTAMAVTVVTRGTSDDANAFEVGDGPLWLRITRSGTAWAFHAATDGRYWRLLRYFSLDERPGERTSVGFLAQSPTGQGCAAVFDRISFTPTAPADLRDGS